MSSKNPMDTETEGNGRVIKLHLLQTYFLRKLWYLIYLRSVEETLLLDHIYIIQRDPGGPPLGTTLSIKRGEISRSCTRMHYVLVLNRIKNATLNVE